MTQKIIFGNRVACKFPNYLVPAAGKPSSSICYILKHTDLSNASYARVRRTQYTHMGSTEEFSFYAFNLCSYAHIAQSEYRSREMFENKINSIMLRWSLFIMGDYTVMMREKDRQP